MDLEGAMAKNVRGRVGRRWRATGTAAAARVRRHVAAANGCVAQPATNAEVEVEREQVAGRPLTTDGQVRPWFGAVDVGTNSCLGLRCGGVKSDLEYSFWWNWRKNFGGGGNHRNSSTPE